MADIDKVKTALGCCIGEFPGEEYCKTCCYQPYRFGKCKADAIKDALELLKVQKEELYKLDRENQLMLERMAEQPQIVRCKDCKHRYPLTKTCNNVDGACCQSYVADDWFCADGERK